VGHHTEAFIGIDTSKSRNAVAIARRRPWRGGAVSWASDQAEMRPKSSPVYTQLLAYLPASVRSLTSPRYSLHSTLRFDQPVAEGRPIRGSATQPVPINRRPLARRLSDGICCPCRLALKPNHELRPLYDVAVARQQADRIFNLLFQPDVASTRGR
jgi:hypothetical protein